MRRFALIFAILIVGGTDALAYPQEGVMMEVARELYHRGQKDKALGALQRVLNIDPQHPEARHYLNLLMGPQKPTEVEVKKVEEKKDEIVPATVMVTKPPKISSDWQQEQDIATLKHQVAQTKLELTENKITVEEKMRQMMTMQEQFDDLEDRLQTVRDKIEEKNEQILFLQELLKQYQASSF